MKYNYITPVVGVPTEDQGVFVFKITSVPCTLNLFNGNVSLVNYIEVDGKEQDVNTFRTYTFTKPGKHYVKYGFNMRTAIGYYSIGLSSDTPLCEMTIPGNLLGVAGFYSMDSLEKVTLLDGVELIDGNCFSNCHNLKEIIIPDSVNQIRGHAFNYCTSLSKFNFPKGVTTIAGNTFRGCGNFKTIIIPNTVTTIGDEAFSNTRNSGETISYLEIPSSVTTIEHQAFSSAIFEKVFIDCDLPDSSSAFYGSEIHDLTLGKHATYLGSDSLYAKLTQNTLTIPETVTHIGNGIFSSSSEVKVLNFNAPVQIYPGYGRLQSIEELNVGKLVPGIAEGSFSGFSNLKTVNLENGLTYIGNAAFVSTVIETIEIPESVTSIGASAFANCSHLTGVICKSTTPPTLGENAFASTNCIIYVPDESVDAYKSAWSEYSSRIRAISSKEDSSGPNTNGHEYVDLGLPSGTLWATMNVGATSPTEYGDYYMYGMGSKTYDSTDTPYAGTEDPLDLTKDTARVVWGGDWHMPTKAQMEELIANTTQQWIDDYQGSGVNGELFTAQNGAVLFLPAAGDRIDGSQIPGIEHGSYWSSTPDDSDYANLLGFFSNTNIVRPFKRTSGYSIRPVIG